MPHHRRRAAATFLSSGPSRALLPPRELRAEVEVEAEIAVEIEVEVEITRGSRGVVGRRGHAHLAQ